MKEIEILVEVYEPVKKVKESFKNFHYLGLKHVIDEYYYDPKRKALKPNNNNELNHCLRLRSKNDEYSITYKDDVFENNKWLYSKEYETKVESLTIMKEIFNRLGLIKFLEIDNQKETYTYNDYKIVIENVKDLGIFLEVEYCTKDDIDIKLEKRKIKDFINTLNLNISEELNMGKPEMYLKKHNIHID